MSYWIEDKNLRQARAIASKDWENPKALLKMRHMANAGATQEEIANELGWDVCWATAAKRLKKYNVTPARNKHGKRIRLGTAPYFKGGFSYAGYRCIKGALK